MTAENFDQYLDPAGVWSEPLADRALTDGKPALFLDRDGVIVEEVNYLHRPADLRLIAGAGEVIGRANRIGLPVVVVTNQAGIARRYYDWPQFIAVQQALTAELAVTGAHLDGVFACPFHGDGQPPYNIADHPARKPNPGLLLAAETWLGIDLSKSWIAGDRATDIGAGRNAGCAGGIHLLTGHGNRPHEREAALALVHGEFQVKVGQSIAGLAAEIPLFQRTDDRSGRLGGS